MEDNNDLFADLPSAKAPIGKVLSHYTSLDGFLSIVNQNHIRASNILFLNDTEEMEYGMKVAREVLTTLTGTKQSQKLLATQNIPDVYACCFCERPDMLSQWRGYGASGQSVSIQFDADQLSALASGQQFELSKVIYGRKQAITLLRKRLSSAESTASIVRSLMGSPDGSDYTADDARRTSILDLAPRFKNDAFEEEKEWRIIVKAHVAKKIDYRVRDNVIIPYVNIGSSDSRLPITRVTVGPGKDSELTRRSIEKFISQNIFYNSVEVATSNIPFRT